MMPSEDDFLSRTLRDRGSINPPLRHAQYSRHCSSPRTLRRKRGGKKGAITLRIRQVDKIIHDRGSRTKLLSLVEQLRVILNDTAAIHEEYIAVIDQADEEYNDEYIEELKMNVDDCISNVAEYLQRRNEDPPSRAMSMSGIAPAAYQPEYDARSCHSDDHDERTRVWCEGQTEDFSKLTSLFQSFSMHDREDEIGLNVSEGFVYGATATSLQCDDQPVCRPVGGDEHGFPTRSEVDICVMPSSSDNISRQSTRPRLQFEMPAERYPQSTQAIASQFGFRPVSSESLTRRNIQRNVNHSEAGKKTALHESEDTLRMLHSSPSYVGSHSAANNSTANFLLPPSHSGSQDHRRDPFLHTHIQSTSATDWLNTQTSSTYVLQGVGKSFPSYDQSRHMEINTNSVPKQSLSENVQRLPSRYLSSSMESGGHLPFSQSYFSNLGAPRPANVEYVAKSFPSYDQGRHMEINTNSVPNRSLSENVERLPSRYLSSSMEYGGHLPFSQSYFSNLGSPRHANVEYVARPQHHHAYSAATNKYELPPVETYPYNAERRNQHNVQGGTVHRVAADHDAFDNSSVDKWIDELPAFEHEYIRQIEGHIAATNMMQRWMINQSLPRIEIPKFDGSPLMWIDFITQFKEIIHMQPYLTTSRRMAFLQLSVEKEAKRAICGFKGDWSGYMAALKRLKFMFGQRAGVAHAHISKVTKGKPVKDMTTLTEFFYDISDCLSNLQRLEYFSDLGSTDVLRQAVGRLPPRLKSRWCERSYSIRRTSREPTLYHLAQWLEGKIMASRDPYMPHSRTNDMLGEDTLSLFATGLGNANMEERSEIKEDKGNTRRERRLCIMCEGDHMISKCKLFTDKEPSARFKTVKDRRLCFNCLRPSHVSKDCKSKFNCFIPDCSKPHHTSLHECFPAKLVTSCANSNQCNQLLALSENEASSTPENVVPNGSGGDVLSITHTGTTSSNRIFFKTVPVRVTSENGTAVATYAFLDDGSEGTFLRKDLADSLKIRGQKLSIKIGTIIDEVGKGISTIRTSVAVSGMHDGAQEFFLKDVLILPKDKFHAKPQCLPTDFETNPTYQHLQGFKFQNIPKDKIQLLIGTSHYETSLIAEIKQGPDNKFPVAAKTPLGWTLFGRLEDSGDRRTSDIKYVNSMNFITSEMWGKLNDNVQQFWSTESFGTEFKDDKPCSIRDRIVQQEWDDSTKFENGHYIVKMPWKDAIKVPPNNRLMAERRARSLMVRLQRDPDLHRLYQEKILEYVEKGYARKLQPEEVERQSGMSWFLPHHPVKNINKPNKIRIVFDCAAKFNNICLNDLLYTGPDLINSLIGILLRFRNYPIAVSADIESMFHQVSVADEDRKALQFLWKEDVNPLSTFDVLQMQVHIFGGKSSPSCTGYALRRAALDSSSNNTQEVTSAIMKDFYVDDFLKSFQSEDYAAEVALGVLKTLEDRGFKLTKFVSNSSYVLGKIPKERLAIQREFLEIEEEPIERTLGVRWNVKKDCFTFSVDCKEHPQTKRGLLQTVSTVFDPIGFITPFTVRAKILLQNLWRKKCNWDETIDDEDKNTWQKWLSEIPALPQFEIPRCYLGHNCDLLKTVQLHIFADASELAFGAVSYVRTMYDDGSIQCCLLFSKSRLAPIKTLTIPRLELQAAVLAVRLKCTILREINIPIASVHFWSDSTIVLQYINNDTKRFKTFVANRVAEIREHSKPTQWCFISGHNNPADAMTRGLTISQLNSKSMWINGPMFLKKEEKSWPTIDALPSLDPDDVEIRNLVVNLTKLPIERLKDISSWSKLVNIMGWAMRFINGCRKRHIVSCAYLTLKDLKNARNSIFRSIQVEHFGTERELLQKGDRVPSGSNLRQLNPYIDTADGLMRVGGRVKHACIPYNAKHQIILPAKNIIIYRLVQFEHKINWDCGPNQLVGHLQDNYWIISVKKLVKGVRKNCLECKKRTAKPQVPLMADLPKFRVDFQTPVFYNTGVDCFGPLYTKIGRRLQKRWGVLFTCLVTRAVHLELAEDLSTDAFINVLQRFINRRGNPFQIASDCGSNFKGADKELASCLKNLEQDRLVGFAARKSINWIFNPPEAPHMGGSWERLIRSVKTPLYNILKNRSLTDLQLSTVFTEVEGLVNSRPLTPVSENPDDLEAITPNHFLLGRRSPNLPFNIVYNADTCSKKRWREVQFLSNQFWQRWIKEYLPQLTRRAKWNADVRVMQAGDLVLLLDSNLPRGVWKLGRITDTYPGDDNRVRVVKVKTQEGSYIRPVAKLCLLEEDQMAINKQNED